MRKDASQIDMSLIREAMDKRVLGLPGARLPPSEAKLRMATVQAARAVAACLTPGLPPLILVSIQPRDSLMSRLIFMPLVPMSKAFNPLALNAHIVLHPLDTRTFESSLMPMRLYIFGTCSRHGHPFWTFCNARF